MFEETFGLTLDNIRNGVRKIESPPVPPLVPEVLLPAKPMDRGEFVDFIYALVDRAVPDSFAGFPSASSLRDYVFDIVFDGLDGAGIVPADTEEPAEVPHAQD